MCEKSKIYILKQSHIPFSSKFDEFLRKSKLNIANFILGLRKYGHLSEINISNLLSLTLIYIVPFKHLFLSKNDIFKH